ncbi:uncharacterized protein [Zea mays]|uniref:uncharacterized protein n=1 Tax=Zea mays TaxID=4577 RepID=UPI0004DEAD88|nr:uncharacterized protein LOC100278449 [Zea mays]XP_008661652.1 uncharacterized protein LOC100278449 [Zea mays]|eukprot:XP_008661647.1 uncharacterized protein LOC100278449 [Zea mays]
MNLVVVEDGCHIQGSVVCNNVQMQERAVIERLLDVVFEEGKPWDWDSSKCSTDQQENDTFIVHYDLTDQNMAIAGDDSNPTLSDQSTGGENSVGQSSGTGQANEPASPYTPISSMMQNEGMGTPSVQQSESSGSGPYRFRTLTDLFDATEQVHDFEYSGVCMLAADEPACVEQALSQDCWKRAMEVELKSVQENQTWEIADLPRDH